MNEPRSPARERSTQLDNLRAAAIAAVVVLHISGYILLHPGSTTSSWQLANLFDASCRWCVPVFVMISGALLLDPSREDTVWMFYRRRIGRIGIPLLFWSAFYLAWRRLALHEALGAKAAALAFLSGRPYYHLYFLFLIAGLYLFTPPLRAFIRRASVREQVMAVVLSLGTAVAAHVIATLLHQNDENALNMFVPYVGYFIGGSLLYRHGIPRQLRIFALPAFILAVVATTLAVSACRAFGNLGGGANFFYDYLSPAVVVMSIAAFTLGISVSAPATGWAVRAARPLSPNALGIYLIHVVFVDLLARREIIMHIHSIVSVPIWSVAVLIAAYLVTRGLRAIPVMRRVVE